MPSQASIQIDILNSGIIKSPVNIQVQYNISCLRPNREFDGLGREVRVDCYGKYWAELKGPVNSGTPVYNYQINHSNNSNYNINSNFILPSGKYNFTAYLSPSDGGQQQSQTINFNVVK